MKRLVLLAVCVIVVAAFGHAQAPAPAQDETITPPQPTASALPQNTVFYFRWNPTRPLEEIPETNSLLRLFKSEEMRVNWVLVKDYFSRMTVALTEVPGEKSRKKPEDESAENKFTEFMAEFESEEVQQFLRNPGIGAVVLPPMSEDGLDVDDPTILFAWHVGDEELFEKAWSMASEGFKPLRKYKRNGLRIRVFGSSKKEEEVWLSRVGPLLVGGSRQKAAQEWMLALRDGTSRLGDQESFRRAAEWRSDESLVEIYFNLAESINFAEEWDSRKPETEKKPGDFDIELGNMFEAFGLKDWQSFLFSLALTEDRTQMTLSSLYAAEHSDGPAVIAGPVPEFPSVGFAPPDTLGYTVLRIDLGAVWGYAERAMRMLLPPQQIRWAFGVRGMIEGMMGVSIRDLADSWGPEYAQVIYIADAEDAAAAETDPCNEEDAPEECVPDLGLRNLYAMHVNNPELIRTVVRNLLPMFAGQLEVKEEETETGTFFEVKRSGEDVQSLKEFAALLTPDWLVFGANRVELERALVRAKDGPALNEMEAYRTARDRFPAELSSFGFDNIDLWLESGKLDAVVQEVGRQIAIASRKKVIEQRDINERERDAQREARVEQEEQADDEELAEQEDTGEEPDIEAGASEPGDEPAGDADRESRQAPAEEQEPEASVTKKGRESPDGKGAVRISKGGVVSMSGNDADEESIQIEENFLLLEFPRLVFPPGFIKWVTSGTTRDEYGIHYVTIIE